MGLQTIINYSLKFFVFFIHLFFLLMWVFGRTFILTSGCTTMHNATP